MSYVAIAHLVVVPFGVEHAEEVRVLDEVRALLSVNVLVAFLCHDREMLNLNMPVKTQKGERRAA